MRTPSQAPRPSRPAPVYGPRAVLSVTALALAALLALLVAASHPTVAIGIAVLALAVRRGARWGAGVRAAFRARRARGFCVPGTNICLRT